MLWAGVYVRDPRQPVAPALADELTRARSRRPGEAEVQEAWGADGFSLTAAGPCENGGRPRRVAEGRWRLDPLAGDGITEAVVARNVTSPERT